MSPRDWTGEIVGHRGAAGLAPENTLESFEAAIAAGADRIEFDVRRTFDGKAVVFHDLNIDRFVPNARGRGVSRLTLAEMCAIDVGSSAGLPDGCLVPSLDATLAALGGRVKLNVEVKGSGADGLLAADLAVAALREAKLVATSHVSTFHEPVLRHLAKSAPDVTRAFIFDERVYLGAQHPDGDPLAIAESTGCEAVHPKSALVDRVMMDRARAMGLLVRPWTVNDESEALRLIELGVDGIVTDFPDRLARLTGRAVR